MSATLCKTYLLSSLPKWDVEGFQAVALHVKAYRNYFDHSYGPFQVKVPSLQERTLFLRYIVSTPLDQASGLFGVFFKNSR